MSEEKQSDSFIERIASTEIGEFIVLTIEFKVIKEMGLKHPYETLYKFIGRRSNWKKMENYQTLAQAKLGHIRCCERIRTKPEEFYEVD